jgi:YD repeat-containing protein
VRWNTRGLLASATEPSLQSTTLTYDARGWLDEVTGADYALEHAYDAGGNLLTLTETTAALGARSVGRTYDEAGRLKTYTNAESETLIPVNRCGFDVAHTLRGEGFDANIRAASGGSSRSYVATWAVRRLTPRECERLQGFPETQKQYSVVVCQSYTDQQKLNALAALQCRKSPSNAWIAGVNGWTLSAEAAAHHFNASQADHAPPVAVDVLIDLERQVVQLHSAERSFSLVASVGETSGFHLPTGVESFARLAALLTHAWALAMQDGKAALLPNTTPFTVPLNGNVCAISFGRETEELAENVAVSIETATRLFMSTTLPLGLDIETLRSTLATLSCCVARAIAGFIPATMSSQSSFVVRLTTTEGYTAVPHRGKPAADGPRYKALGNSMAVPVMRWIGERIAMVDAIAAPMEQSA